MSDIDVTAGLGLSLDALRVYEAACHGFVTAASLADELGLGIAAAEQEAATLRGHGLLGSDPSDPDRYLAIAPDSAAIRLLGPIVRNIATAQQHVDQIRADLAALGPVYSEGTRQAAAPQGMEAISDLDVVRRVITEFAAGAHQEVLTSQPGGARPDEVLGEAMARTEALLTRKVRLKTIYQHSAQFSPATTAYVEHVTKRGAEVRTTVAGFARALIFDRRAAVLPLHGSEGGAVIVHDRSIVGFAADAFERAWDAAAPFPIRYSRRQVMATSEEIRDTIIELLTRGEPDRRIAERVGLSLRTCQRHVAEILDEIGARNRLHAGYLLHERRMADAARGEPRDAPTT